MRGKAFKIAYQNALEIKSIAEKLLKRGQRLDFEQQGDYKVSKVFLNMYNEDGSKKYKFSTKPRIISVTKYIVTKNGRKKILKKGHKENIKKH